MTQAASTRIYIGIVEGCGCDKLNPKQIIEFHWLDHVVERPLVCEAQGLTLNLGHTSDLKISGIFVATLPDT